MAILEAPEKTRTRQGQASMKPMTAKEEAVLVEAREVQVAVQIRQIRTKPMMIQAREGPTPAIHPAVVEPTPVILLAAVEATQATARTSP